MAYNFTGALAAGNTPQQITNYLVSQGRGNEASTYFNTQPSQPTGLQAGIQGLGNFAQSVAAPFTKMVGTAIRGAQSIPDVLSGNEAGAAAIQKEPILGQPTAPGSSPLQNLGSALQTGSFALGGEGAGALLGGEGAGALSEAPSLGTMVLQGAKTGAEVGAAQGLGGYTANEAKPTLGGGLEATGAGAIGGAAVGGAIPIAGGVANALGEHVSNLGSENAQGARDWFNNLSGKNKLTAEANDVNLAQNEVTTAEQKVNEAAQARNEAAPRAVDSYGSMVEKVTGHKSQLGTNFETAAQKLTTEHPELKLNLTNAQLEQLQNLKESKSFALPDYVEKQGQPITFKGKPFEAPITNKSAAAQIAAATGKVSGETAVSLTPSEAQDLITQLNKGTFSAKASGQLAVNQQMIGLTNDIKQSASTAFGDQWNKIYSDYAKGVNAIQKLDDIMNLDKNATASDYNQNLKAILNLSKTPEGKVLLQNAIQDYKDVSGIDLNNHTQIIQDILDKENAQQEAEANLAEAKKNLTKTQRTATQVESRKGQGIKNTARYVGRSSLGGAIRIGMLYPVIRMIQKAASGK